MRGYLGAIDLDYILMYDNAQPHITHIVDEFHEGAEIHSMECPSISLNHNSIEYVWDVLGNAISRRSSPKTPTLPKGN
ncbi:hypothetical protein TNCV_2956371 [Trichonephila clavipes]|nr:hypothetical protein TNCV_2956371 [Trichonephila clavipes]